MQGKLVAVLGYGQEGKAVAGYLLKHGIKPVLFDQKPWEKWEETDKLEIKKLGLNFIFGPDCFMELAGFDVAFRSPGVNPKQFTINNLQLTSQTKWFFEHCPAKIIGVTGTKGKGTTSSLIYGILALSLRGGVLPTTKQSSPDERLPRPSDALGSRNDTENVYLTGNIGKVQPLEILDNLNSDDYIVYELSSFQLQDLTQSPHIAVVLMTTSEHLDYHKDENEYVKAKSSITKFQSPDDFAVVNADFENSKKIGLEGNGKKVYFSRKQELAEGSFVQNGVIIWRSSENQGLEELIEVKDLQLKGDHNLENVCAAVSVGKILQIDNSVIRTAIAGFNGLEHRLEFVLEKQGIKFYNDSFSTTPETAIAAIKSFFEPEIVILGGSSKNSDFSELAKTVIKASNIKSLILIGQEASKIKEGILNTGEFKGRIFESAKSMEEIFAQIKTIAKTGDIVLLSPACASFGMFKNYKDRGEQFKNSVRNF